jgi:hypothetical protein
MHYQSLRFSYSIHFVRILVLVYMNYRIINERKYKVYFCLLFLGCEHTNLWADEYWECMARHYTVTIYHPAGIYSINIKEAYLTLPFRHSLRITFIDSKIFAQPGFSRELQLRETACYLASMAKW